MVTVGGMNASRETWRESNKISDKTAASVREQVAAMGSELLEVGLYNPNARTGESVMIPRIWDAATLIRCVPWLRHQSGEFIVHLIFKCLKTWTFAFRNLADTDDLFVRSP